MRQFWILVAAVSILLTPAARGQTALRFDVVAIRENKSPAGKAGMSLRNGSLQVNELLLKSPITSAYGVHEGLIFGMPNWAEEARYDIRYNLLRDEGDGRSMVSG